MNIGFVLAFLVAHFLGDFVFQTDKIAKEKAEHIKGTLFHSVVVLTFQIVLLAVFGIGGIIAGLISGILHFMIDYGKLVLGRHITKYNFVYFVFDQALHIGIIFILAYIIKPQYLLSDEIFLLLKYLAFIIFYTYITTVMCKTLLRDLYDSVRNMPFFCGKERVYDGIFSLILSMAFVLAGKIFTIVITVIISISYFAVQQKISEYNLKIIFSKWSFYILLAICGAYLFAII